MADLDFIKQTLNRGVLRLDSDTLNAKVLVDALHLAFPETAVSLTAVPNSFQETDNTLRFQAIGEDILGVYELPVEVIFLNREDNLECVLIATLPSGWDFSWAYPDLPDYYNTLTGQDEPSFFQELRFVEPMQVVFSSFDLASLDAADSQSTAMQRLLNGRKVYPGLNYFAALDLNKFKGVGAIFEQFAGIQLPHLDFHGRVEPSNAGSHLKLFFDLDFSKQYHDIFHIGLSQAIFYTSTSIFDLDNSSGIIFAGFLHFGDGASNLEPNVQVIWPVGSQELIIRNAEPLPFPSLDTFAQLLEGHLPQDQNAFPVDPTLLTNLAIRDLALHTTLGSSAGVELSLSIGPSGDWRHSFLDDAISVEDILLQWNLAFGVSGKSIRFSLLSAFRIGGGLVQASAELPGFRFFGSLGLQQTIELKTIFDHFLPNAPLPAVDIVDLELEADFKQGDYQLELEVASDWEIPLAGSSIMLLKGLRIDLEKDNNGTFASIHSYINIAGVDLTLFAAYHHRGTESGWQFSGQTGAHREIPIGKLFKELAVLFGTQESFPNALEGIVFSNLKTSFDTHNRDFTFTGQADFPVGDDAHLALAIRIELSRQQDGSFEKLLSGSIRVLDFEFDLIFDARPDSKIFLAAYRDLQGRVVKVDRIISTVFALEVTTGLQFTLHESLLAIIKDDAGARFLFGLDIEGGLNLSDLKLPDLPLVGNLFPDDQTLKLAFQIFVASKPFAVDPDLTLLSELAGPEIPIPQQNIDSFALSTTLSVGGEVKHLNLPVGLNHDESSRENDTHAADNGLTAAPAQSTVPDDSHAVSNDGTKWIKIQKTLGPVHVERLGIHYQDSKITGLLDASLGLGGLSLSLDGLSVKSPLSKFEPEFDLHGLGIGFESGAVGISGAFLRQVVTPPQGEPYTVFSGLASVHAEVLSLSAIGSYAKFQGQPSLFIYAVLDYPLGGPSFFFVTGLAGGFGYNRALYTPEIDAVKTFPLVEAAIASQPSPIPGDKNELQTSLTEKLNKLNQYIPPKIGDLFFAVGIKFTSFKLIDSFALLIVKLGSRFEIDLLGISTLVSPPPEVSGAVPPVVKAELAIKATFIPEEGFLGVEGQLTAASFVISPDCHLTGGFAFYCWFLGEHAGDFVATLGGYHPQFHIPKHYPKVPRLGLSWQVNDLLSIKGQEYFALTAHALMAGGSLEALFQTESLKAWFKANADFLISWQPYHYDARLSVEIGAEATIHFFGTHHLSFDAGADLHLWGPEFAGEAHVHVKVMGFKVSFDVEFGAGQALATPIAWDAFKSTFLPPAKDVCTLSIQSGLVRKIEGDDGRAGRWVINPKEICIAAQTAIPITRDHSNDDEIMTHIGVKPMGLLAIDSEFELEILDTNGVDQSEHFVRDAILKPVPSGLWGQAEVTEILGTKFLQTPKVNAEQMIPDTHAGYTLKAKRPILSDSHSVDPSKFRYETETIADAFQWNDLTLHASSQGAAALQSAKTTIVANKKRETLLSALGMQNVTVDFKEPVDLGYLLPTVTPQTF